MKSESDSCSVVSDSLRFHDCSPPGSSVHGILQAGILGVGSRSLLQGIFPTQDRTWVSHIAGRFFTVWATKETLNQLYVYLFPSLLNLSPLTKKQKKKKK